MKFDETKATNLLSKKRLLINQYSSENKLNNRIALFKKEDKHNKATKEENKLKFNCKASHDIQYNIPSSMPFSNFNLLSKGGFSYVYKCQRFSELFSDNYVCCKYIPKIIYYDRTFEGTAYEDCYMKNILVSEVDSMRCIQSKNSVEFLTHSKTEDGGFVVFLKYYQNGCLLTFLSNNNLYIKDSYCLPTFLFKYIAWQFFSFLGDLEEHGIQHNDIKPENILVDDNLVLRLSDYGLSRKVESHLTAPKRFFGKGTCFYLSPEKILKTKMQAKSYVKHAFKVDVWAVGVTLFLFSANSFPFSIRKDDGKARMLRKMTQNKLEFKKVKLKGESNFLDLLTGMLEIDIEERFTSKQVLASKFAVECKNIFEDFQSEIQEMKSPEEKIKYLKKKCSQS